MLRRTMPKDMAATAATFRRVRAAQDVIRIGMSMSLTGSFRTAGRQCLAGASSI